MNSSISILCSALMDEEQERMQFLVVTYLPVASMYIRMSRESAFVSSTTR